MFQVLDKIRVIDFGRYVAGPSCAAILADFGADVIRVEKRQGSEDRRVAPVTPNGDGAIFLQLNRNKRSLALDLRRDGAAAIIKRLIATADVVVANVPPKMLATMGLDYETLSITKPDIILANISAFGPIGPWQDRGGFDSIGQVMSGSAFLTGGGDRPVRTPVSWVDYSTSLYAAIGIAMALIDRSQTGLGQQIDATLLGSALALSATYVLEEAMIGADRSPAENRSFISGPTDIFATSDGWIAVQVVGDPLFRRWAALMEEPKWLEDHQFASDNLRGINGKLLSERMAIWCVERSTDTALVELANAGIPAGPVLSPREVIRHPQVVAMDLFRKVDYPGATGGVPLMDLPVSMSRSVQCDLKAPPTLGQHTGEILLGLGFLPDEIAQFHVAEVI